MNVEGRACRHPDKHEGADVTLGPPAVLSVLATSLGLSLQQPAFRAKTETVSVYATVRGADGHLVPALERQEFQVLDDGRPADVTVFSNKPQPFSVAVMLDMSGGGAYRVVRLRDAVGSFVMALHPEDRAVVGSFSGREVATGPPRPTSDKSVLLRVLREELWPILDSTPLWQGLDAGMTGLEGETSRRVVLVLTRGRHWTPADGRLTPGWRHTLGQVLERAVAEDVMIYAVGLEGSQLRGDISILIDATGGGRFEVPDEADLAATFERVADELRHQYLLGFTPRVLDGKTHRIEVKVSRLDAIARARKQYLAPNRR